MKIDCSITKNFLKEKGRMTKNCTIKCSSFCPFDVFNNSEGMFCHDFQAKYPDEAIAIVQKWSDEHPPKTYRDDFFEKFPGAVKDKDGYPLFAPDYIYNKDLFRGMNHYDAWDKVMEE